MARILKGPISFLLPAFKCFVTCHQSRKCRGAHSSCTMRLLCLSPQIGYITDLMEETQEDLLGCILSSCKPQGAIRSLSSSLRRKKRKRKWSFELLKCITSTSTRGLRLQKENDCNPAQSKAYLSLSIWLASHARCWPVGRFRSSATFHTRHTLFVRWNYWVKKKQHI